MKANPGRDTRPEIALRAALHRAGLRFRKDLRVEVEGKHVRPDIAFPRRRVAVFLDGCFWHGCPEHGDMPAANRDFWQAKIGRTRERDLQQTRALEGAEWTVIRIWEHEPLEDAIARVVEAVAADMPAATEASVRD